MEWQRVVEIHDEPSGGHGSGYLLAPSLVLTARHVIDGARGLELRRLEPDEHGFPGKVSTWKAARIAWTSVEADLALLAPRDREPAFLGAGGATSIGRLDGRAPVPVHALGFPRALNTPTHSDALHVNATVNAWSGARGEGLLLAVDGVQPKKGEDWKGISGAAVFAGDRLVGVLEAVPEKLEALRATPAHLLFEDAAANELLGAAGVALSADLVDARYVEKLPPAGNWGGVREQYARKVVATFCSIDFLGLSVPGAPDRRKPALAAFTGRRLALWPDTATRRDPAR